MRREVVSIEAPAIGRPGELIAYGDWGRPLLAFPSERGNAGDWEHHGMVDAVRGLIDAGRLKLYCVGSYDAESWFAGVGLEEAARRHERYEAWLTDQVAPWIDADCGGRQQILLAGASFGAYHAANLALRRADRFPLAVCLSGVYDVTQPGGGERGDAVYFNNPMDSVAGLHGDHLAWLRERVSLLLVCGQGQWEDTTGALESTRAFAQLLAEKGLRHELDLWGHDVPHDWPSWRRQLAHHLDRIL